MDASTTHPPNLVFHNANPSLEGSRSEIIEGLQRDQKQLSPKWFYDEEGSKLFEQITRLPEYYPTRTEVSILEQYRAEITDACGAGCVFIEPGSGNCEKARLLLDHLRPTAFVPLDISADFLLDASQQLAREYPWLDVHAICADFNQGWPFFDGLPEGKRVFFYPGSTIGNLEPEQALSFLSRVREVTGDDGGMLVGVDLHKCSDTLHAAYNDRSGITAQFNLNILSSVNELLNVELNEDLFTHKAFYNEEQQRIEMHLVSEAAHRISGDDFDIRFEPGESIHTENSYKYTIPGFTDLVSTAGFQLERSWLDDDALFSVHYLSASPQ